MNNENARGKIDFLVNMCHVRPLGIEPRYIVYKTIALPLSYRREHLAYHFRDSFRNARVEHVGDDLLRRRLWHKRRNRFGGSYFHFVRYFMYPMIESATKNSRKCERIIY